MARRKVETEEPKPELEPTRLVDVITEADRQTDISNARAMCFDNANAATEKPIDPQMTRLVERAFAPMDWEKTMDAFDAWMSLGEKRTEEAYVRRAHEIGPAIARDVYDVYMQVRYAREAWELENDVVLGGMREEATKVLELEKERKIRTKAITIDDVTRKAASMFPDEWAAQEKRRLQYTLVENRSKQCVELATLRCRILDSMMARLRVT
jgi:hypothetical protein